MKNYVSLLLLLCLSIACLAQDLPVASGTIDDRARIEQIADSIPSNRSFFIRHNRISFDSLLSPHSDARILSSSFGIFPLVSRNVFASHHPYSWNDGSMILSKGYQQQLSVGFFAKWGHLSIQLRPEVVFAENKKFHGFSTHHNDTMWSVYYREVLNIIDAPERFGGDSYLKVLPGQSHIHFNIRNVAMGISTENMWWGPGVRNSLLMSNTSAGFPHLTVHSIAPANTRLGSFEWQLIAGRLASSGIIPPDTLRRLDQQQLYRAKTNGDRYLNGMVLTWQPKWIRGLHLGFARVFYQYVHNVPNDLNGYLPVFGALFKGGSRIEDEFGRDQLLAIYGRLIFQKDHAEVYFEYGRNDHSQNIGDLAMEPEHARAFILGLKKVFRGNSGKKIEFLAEITNLQGSGTTRLRASDTWYTHLQVRHGYTYKGQLIGAGIGPGSNSQTIGLNFFQPQKQFGVFLERIVRNNDLYYDMFAQQRNYESHWVDLSLNAHYTKRTKRFIYRGDLSLVRSLNYQWRYDNGNPLLNAEGQKNVNNVVAGLTISYLLK